MEIKIKDLIQKITNQSEPDVVTNYCNQLKQLIQPIQDTNRKAIYLNLIISVYQHNFINFKEIINLFQEILSKKNISSRMKVETLARKSFFHFINNQYDSAKECHNEAIEICESSDQKQQLYSLIYAIYTKQKQIDTDSSIIGDNYTIQSIISQLRNEEKQSYLMQYEALSKYKQEKNNQKIRFSIYRLKFFKKQKNYKETLEEWNNLNVSYEEQKRMSNKNNILKHLFQFTVLLDQDKIKNKCEAQKQELLLKLKTIANKYRESNRQEVQYIQKKIQEIQNQQKFPMFMLGSAKSIESTMVNKQSKIQQSKIQQSKIQQNKIQPSKISQSKIKPTYSQDVSDIDEKYWDGSYLLKINHDSSGGEKRFFYLNKQKMRLYYCDKRKNRSDVNDYYSIKQFVGVKEGKGTKPFQRAQHKQLDENLCFSLEFKTRTRDFCAYKQQDYNTWVKLFTNLFQKSQIKKKLKNQSAIKSLKDEESVSPIKNPKSAFIKE